MVVAGASLLQHAAVGFAVAVLSLFLLAFAVVAVVLVTVSNTCWWTGSEDDSLVDEINDKYDADETVDIVLGVTPQNASIV